MSKCLKLEASFVRRGLGLVALATCTACFGGDCNDDPLPSITYSQPTISSVYPCAALPGETVRVSGSNLVTGAFTIGGQLGQFVSGDASNWVVKVDAGASGIGLSFVGSGGFASAAFKVLTGVAVPEVEPNNDINGADATNTLSERKGSGTLSSPADKDHFYIDCLDPVATYKIKVIPATFGPVYVNGGAVVLDGNGEGTIAAGTANRLIGLTGHAGAYTIELTKQ